MCCAFSIKYSKVHYLKAIYLTSQNDWPPCTLSWSLSLKLWMLFICIMFIVHFSALFKFFCPGGHGPSPLQGGPWTRSKMRGLWEPMFCPHTSLPYHSFPLSQRSSGSMPVSCKVPTIKLTWTVFFKKIIVFPFSHLIHFCMTFMV